MRLYIIRHADPDYANNTITLAGHLEAQALAKWLVAETVTHIFCSPLGRAMDTMKYTAAESGLPCQIEEWTREIGNFGIALSNGKRGVAWNIDGEMVRAKAPWPTQDNWHRRPPLDDPKFLSTFEDLKAASDEFLARLGYVREGGVYRIVHASKDRIAVFCHAGFATTWLAHLLELPLPLTWTGFLLLPSSVTTVLFDERSPQYAVPRCIALGQTAHLYEANLPIQPRGVVANFD